MPGGEALVTRLILSWTTTMRGTSTWLNPGIRHH